MIGIYKITSPSKKVYIGQTTDYRKRITKYKQGAVKTQTRLYHSLKKYGFEKHKFEFLIECSIEELNDLERYYQDLYCCLNKNGLNCRLTNSYDRNGRVSDETKKRMSIARLNKPQFYSKERREAIGNARRGKKLPKEVIDKIITTRKAKGTKPSQATKDKIRKAHLGRKASNELRQKLSDAYPNKILVINIENGIFYNSIKEAAKFNDINYTTLQHWLNGMISVNKSNLRYA